MNGQSVHNRGIRKGARAHWPKQDFEIKAKSRWPRKQDRGRGKMLRARNNTSLQRVHSQKKVKDGSNQERCCLGERGLHGEPEKWGSMAFSVFLRGQKRLAACMD